MKTKQYKVLGHVVAYSIPESSVEFNALDPSREDAACDEANSNIVYRVMNPDTRYFFLHGRDATDTAPAIVGVEETTRQLLDGVVIEPDDQPVERKTTPAVGKDGKPRIKDGEPVTKFTEAEEVYYNRALALLVKYGAFDSEDAARAHFQSQIESIAASVVFDPKATERAERAPKKVSKLYKEAAAKVLAVGTLAKVNKNQLAKIGKSFEPTGDTSKMFTGVFKDAEGKETAFNVSDKDADALGGLIKEYFAWKEKQALSEF